MRDKDIKILWGRSGNRCAICKLELTPDGSRETLGEMAHIVARSSDGPRGDENVSLAERDGYDNLILLCPTHHVEVDKAPSTWSVSHLCVAKTDHERRVSDQLNVGGIKVAAIDNTVFLAERETSCIESSRGHIAMVLSLTPLRVSSEALDPLDKTVQDVLEQARIPNDGRRGEQVNRYRTRPTEYGVANEDFPESSNSYGHSIQIFRSGHCEYLCELGAGVDHITQYVKNRGTDLKGATRVLRYTDIAAVADYGLTWLCLVWKELFPFNYMTFSGVVTNTTLTTMYSREDGLQRWVFGFPIKSPVLTFSDVLPKNFDRTIFLLELLRRLVNSYGLVLHQVYDDAGDYVRPERMR